MTGFGVAEHAVGNRLARVEIRTVNHRFFNLAARLPAELSSHEGTMRELLKSRFDRGHISVTVQWTDQSPTAMAVINLDRAVEVNAALHALATKIGLSGPISLDSILRFPDVVGTRREEGTGQTEWAEVLPAFEMATESCLKSRRAEGAVLALEIERRLDAIETEANEVEALLPGRLDRELNRLRQAVSTLANGAAVPEERLAVELAILADRVDVTEELVRLRAHLQAARGVFGETGPVGKRLGFLAQELGREVNTLGSKANDATIAHRVITMKGELEKIREQLENVE